jgi:5-methyltetrahydrofolate--homocysteine methyltransferase
VKTLFAECSLLTLFAVPQQSILIGWVGVNAEELLGEIRSAVESLDFQKMREALRQARNAGVPGYTIVTKGILEGVKRSGEIGLLLAAEALKKEVVTATDSAAESGNMDHESFSGKVVIGTVQGDIHDFGKSILVSLLRSVGIEVEDLGIDVPPSDFASRAVNRDVRVIGLSSLLASGFEKIKETVKALEDAGLRDKVRVIVGGAALSPEIASDVKADAYAEDAVKGLEIIRNWLANHRRDCVEQPTY